MQTLVVYDIGDTRLRSRIEKVCRDAGMERTQYSAFLGECAEDRRARLIARVEECVRLHVAEEDDEQRRQKLVVQVFPICAADFAKAVVVARDPAPSRRGGALPRAPKPEVLVL